ncbi:hypothetical protein LY71_112105 [Geodermatophilus tzadiensis]|uniref:SnoaL-like protein n=1 Tax=Geodermatophilus tzadiensis TaxID=1137988 RepID=A0A2T0TQF5_9ACTN|nr:hypothetical protein LY71_112105 [Geodermatophilus tzadiensis]
MGGSGVPRPTPPPAGHWWTSCSLQEQFPGFVHRPAGPVDAHHDQVRFTWHLGPEGAEPPVTGFDVAVTDGDGRIRTVLGFLDRVPG